MRSLSVGATLSVLLVVAVLLWGPLSKPAAAQSGVTLGFAADGAGRITSSELGEEIGRYLSGQLSIPVKVRSFATEEQLYLWLTRFHEVDVAWLSKRVLDEIPAGQLYPLARNQDHSPGLLYGEAVAWQGMNAVLRQQLRTAFLDMHESPAGRVLLSKLEINRFVSPEEGGALDVAETELHVETTPNQDAVKIEAAESQEALSPVGLPVIVSGQPLLQDQTEPQDEPPVVSQVDVLEELPLPVFEQEDKELSSVAPAPKVDQEAPIALVADYLAYNSEEDSYEAKGDVVLRQDGVELKSEELLWQSATQDAAAQGSVFLNDAGTELSGEHLQYNMATGQGQVSDGRVFVSEGNFHLAGEQIEKHGQTEYFVKDGSFTTCDGEIPDWKFSASEIDVTLGGYARAKNVWFHVKDVPVLYTPYLKFPVKTERESGLLMPSFGYSNNKGTLASLAWYQVIDRNMDATIYLDYLSEIGLGKGLEYRYALANQNNGEARYYHVTGFSETPDLYYLEWEHRGKLPGEWRLTADVEYANEKLFFEEFGEVAEDYNRDKTVSTVMLRRNWEKVNLVGYGRYIKDLEDDDFETLQRLPELGLGLIRYRLGDTPFYAGLESYATRFSRDEGEDGERLYLKPSLSAVFKPGSWLEVVPEVALHERIYNADAADDDKFIPEFSLGLATRTVRSFDANLWGFDRIQHSIEPKAAYTYVPDESQEDLPLFDLYDRIEGQNDIAYALVNRLVARSTKADGSKVYRELFNLRLSQSYDIDEKRNNRSGENQPFSDVRVEMGFNPSQNISMDVDSRIPVYGDTRFRTLSVGTSVKDEAGNAVKVQYSYKGEDFAHVATDYVKVRVDTSLLKPVYARFEERYDFQENRELEKVVGLEYRSKCWSILMTYRDRYREDGDDDQEFMVTFVLAGLGQDQGFGGGF